MPQSWLVLRDLRGGRNGGDPPDALPDNQAVEMLNVDHYTGLLANKRQGCTAVTDSGGTAFSLGIQSLFRFVPGADETLAELWGIDGAATPIVKRMAGGSTFANVTLTDAITQADASAAVAVTFNGKLYIAYNSAVDNLHVYDPTLSSPRVRRTEFSTPGAPSIANTGSGSYAATLRYYRVRWLQLNGSIVERMSPEGTAASFTPSGSGTAARVTQPSVPSQQETHWRVEGSSDNSSWYILSSAIAIGTTTYDDSVNPSAYATTYTASAAAGEYTNWISVKYLLTDGNRLLGSGAWESGNPTSRVWFSPVLGTTDEGDAERVPSNTTHKNWVDLNERDGGFITGMGGPIYGAPYVFKYRQVWKLTPTGDVTTPYIPRKLSDAHGCVNHKSITPGFDAAGNPCIYFWSFQGPCRVVIRNGVSVIEYLGRDIEDITSQINLTTSAIVVHGVYHADKHQVWWWVTTSSQAGSIPDTKVVFDVLLGKYTEGDRVRGGWYKHTGNSAVAICSCMEANTLGATMSKDLKPYIGAYAGSSTALWKCDSSANGDDAGTNFQAYIDTRPLKTHPYGEQVGLGPSTLIAKPATGVTIRQTSIKDYGLGTPQTADSAVLTAAGSESRVIRKIEASDDAACRVVQIRLGDAAATSFNWSLDSLSIPITNQGPW